MHFYVFIISCQHKQQNNIVIGINTLIINYPGEKTWLN